MIAIKHVLVATDFSEPSDAALLYGRQLAHSHGATLHLVHVIGSIARDMATSVGMGPNVGMMQVELEADARRRLEALVAGEAAHGLVTRVAVLGSTPIAQAILDYADQAGIDLIVVGTHGRTGLAHFFMGSVAQHVVRRASCPVLTVRHPEREFVVPDAVPTMVAAS